MGATRAINPKPPWRPTKLTPKVAEIICRELAETYVWAEAARRAGITNWTLREWRNKGAIDQANGVDSPYSRLLAGIEAAIAEWEAKRNRDISKHAEKSWQASAWQLERRMPEKYALKSNVNVTANRELIESVELELYRLGILKRVAGGTADGVTEATSIPAITATVIGEPVECDGSGEGVGGDAPEVLPDDTVPEAT